MGKKSKKQIGFVRTNVVSPIKDESTLANQGVILINQKTMQEIFKKTGPLAKDNEFQTHFWSVNYRYQGTDGSILDIAIPTVHFNYKQEVSSAAIAFDLKDVSSVSTKLEPVHNMMVNELNKFGLKEQLEEALGVSLEQWDVPLNSIHRHPGSLHSFSSTDLCKTASEPGVVYPLAKPQDNQPNFAGIMTIHNNVCKVGHYEYRTAKGELGTDITYTQGRCASLIIGESQPTSLVEQIIGIKEKSTSYANYVECSYNEILEKLHEIADSLYLNYGFEAFTKAINESNVTKATSTVTTYSYDRDAEYRLYNHKYQSPAELEKNLVWALNGIHKKLKFIKEKKISTAYISSVPALVTTITSLQEELGYTEDQPYGKDGFKLHPYEEYEKLYAYDLKSLYEAMCIRYDEPVATKNQIKKELMDGIKIIIDKYGEPAPVSSDLTLADIIDYDTSKFTKEHKKTFTTTLSIIEPYADVKFIEISEDKFCDRNEIIDQIGQLEALYYARSTSYNRDHESYMELETELKELQETIQEEIDENLVILRGIIDEYESVEQTTDDGTLSTEDKKKALEELGTTPYLLQGATPEDIATMYDKIFHD